MQTSKIFIISFLLLIIGCKKNIIKNDIVLNKKDTIKVNDSISISKNSTAKIKDENLNSFVISCGSGCAMTYTAKNISQEIHAIKVNFNVDMYVDETLSDTFDEAYIFKYDSSNKIIEIQLEGKNENILRNLLPDAQKSFIEFGYTLINNKKTIPPKGTTFLYHKETDPKTAKYETIEIKAIKGLEKYSCDNQKVRYIPLPNKSEIKLFLVPQDCGDFEYRYYLLTIKNNIVIADLYIEGEWYEPDDEFKTITTFSIDDKYNIEVKTQNPSFSKTENYIITNGGEIIKQ